MVKPTVGAVVLAAGKGTRMKSSRPKVMIPLLEEPILYYPLKALSGVPFLQDIAVIVGWKKEEVESYLRVSWPQVVAITQEQQFGTGHAAQIASSWFSKYDHVVIMPGDVPLVESETLKSLIEEHVEKCSDSTFWLFALQR